MSLEKKSENEKSEPGSDGNQVRIFPYLVRVMGLEEPFLVFITFDKSL